MINFFAFIFFAQVLDLFGESDDPDSNPRNALIHPTKKRSPQKDTNSPKKARKIA